MRGSRPPGGELPPGPAPGSGAGRIAGGKPGAAQAGGMGAAALPARAPNAHPSLALTALAPPPRAHAHQITAWRAVVEMEVSAGRGSRAAAGGPVARARPHARSLQRRQHQQQHHLPCTRARPARSAQRCSSSSRQRGGKRGVRLHPTPRAAHPAPAPRLLGFLLRTFTSSTTTSQWRSPLMTTMWSWTGGCRGSSSSWATRQTGCPPPMKST